MGGPGLRGCPPRLPAAWYRAEVGRRVANARGWDYRHIEYALAGSLLEDVHVLARGMPHTTVWDENADRPVYEVGGRSFVFFGSPQPDARDPETGERYDDVICVWVPSGDDTQALVQGEGSPWFTTSHFDGHPSVLVPESRLGELGRDELAEVIEVAVRQGA